MLERLLSLKKSDGLLGEFDSDTTTAWLPGWLLLVLFGRTLPLYHSCYRPGNYFLSRQNRSALELGEKKNERRK